MRDMVGGWGRRGKKRAIRRTRREALGYRVSSEMSGSSRMMLRKNQE
jgi:hypothetical protein